MSAGSTTTAPLLTALILSLSMSGCGLVNKMAGNSMAGLMEATSDVWASDEDPELVCESLPFALSTVEGLILRQPGSERFLLTAAKAFTQYAYVCVETDAILLEAEEYERSRQQEERALRLYLRAKRYGIRGLAEKYEGIEEQLSVDPDSAVARTTVKDVPLLYWTAASWGAAISLGKDRPDLIADLPTVIAMMRRILELDEAFGDGAVHDLFIVIEGLPANMGGSPEKASEHFERALVLNGGRLASAYLTYATSVMLPEQNRERFERLMLEALAVNPDDLPSYRLQNLIVQRRARYLLDHVDDYFVE